jgi:hypothetical protein
MIHAKKRELKKAPHMFAIIVFEIKIYFSVTQSNIEKIIFPYFPQQTMTLNESELMRRLLFFSDITKDSNIFLGILNRSMPHKFASTFSTLVFPGDALCME